MLFSRPIIEAVADFLAEQPVPLVVDPVMVSASGAQLLQDDAVEALVTRLFPLATVITPNLDEAQALGEVDTEDRGVLAEQLHALGAPAVIVTGGHGERAVDHLFTSGRHVEISGRASRRARRRTAPAARTRRRWRRCSRRDSRSRKRRAAPRRPRPTRSRTGWSSWARAKGPVDVLGLVDHEAR